MGEGIGVRPADLITHAAHVEAVGDHVVTTQQAGNAVRAGTDAYGRLCVMVPVMLGVLQDTLIDKIAETADSLHDTGARLRTAAQSYEAADQHRADVLDQIKGRM